MTLNGWNARLVEVNKFRRPPKNFDEDRPISLLGKCRPLHLFAINIKCMQICVGFHRRKYICHLYLRPYSLTALVFILLLIFPAQSTRLALARAMAAQPNPKANKRRLKIMEKTERGRIQGLPKFMRCSQLFQERLKLWTSNLAGTFASSIRAKGR